MTKVKVGKEDQSSNEFLEKRRSALERCTLFNVLGQNEVHSGTSQELHVLNSKIGGGGE